MNIDIKQTVLIVVANIIINAVSLSEGLIDDGDGVIGDELLVMSYW
jgi:hypothetical protein